MKLFSLQKKNARDFFKNLNTLYLSRQFVIFFKTTFWVQVIFYFSRELNTGSKQVETGFDKVLHCFSRCYFSRIFIEKTWKL